MATGILKKGTKIRVKFTGEVRRTASDYGLTPDGMYFKVYEDPGNSVHIIALDSDRVTETKAVVRTVNVEFDAVVEGEHQEGPLVTTQVRETGGAGYTHYVYTNSPVVTVLEDEKGARIDTSTARRGDKIRVDITAKVVGDMASSLGRFSTQEVSENAGFGYTHFLYLPSPSVTGDKAKGGTVRGQFDAEITGEPGVGELKTTQVRVINPDGSLENTHFVFLNSPSVTRLEEKEPADPEPAKLEPAKTGDRFRVAINGTVSGETSMFSTYGVAEDGGFKHFLFFGSDFVTGDRRQAGETARAEFDAEIMEKPGTGKQGTTQVREIVGGGPYGYTHFVDLASPSVTRLDQDGNPVPVPEPVPPRNADTSGRVESVLARIKPGDATIESADVIKRIQDLEDSAVREFRIVRDRTGERVEAPYGLTTGAAALEYLESLDYNPARFTIVPVEAISEADQEELTLLRELDEAGRREFGGPRWIGGVQLRNDNDFDADWGREEARKRLNLFGSYALDEWPLSQIDWNDAVGELLNAEYFQVTFGGTEYWGKISD